MEGGEELTNLPSCHVPRAPREVSTFSESTATWALITEWASLAHFTDGETEVLRH